ncbi:uracil-DNA glycosylase family protein [Paenibacillus sp. J22TS3]|uniref:uracil-DNA glycosylase family protein n=1 Tax=Paenibacillus sp. J22TS3 TaxID=2807192 RepID=UPI001B207E72|nr:uracil-DNA glycosylase family protein [Paenibacillus sp. J22TS3]GIP22066.1 hypothetical protein J22TS3_23410 [Paenibacillus sp. J22TS3]
MVLISGRLKVYKSAIRALPSSRRLTPTDLLTPDFLMEQSGPIQMYYAPHNEYLNASASVVITGITPGWTQMRAAYESAAASLAEGLGDAEVCMKSKKAASFAGPMRNNLINMLDELGLQTVLKLPTCRELFGQERTLLHTTSLLRFPVFVHGKNYTGASPALLSHALLRNRGLGFIREELALLDQRALIIPLGKAVEQTMRAAQKEGWLEGRHILWGFPHPSGANGHRVSQFRANFEQMRAAVHGLFRSPYHR